MHTTKWPPNCCKLRNGFWFHTSDFNSKKRVHMLWNLLVTDSVINMVDHSVTSMLCDHCKFVIWKDLAYWHCKGLEHVLITIPFKQCLPMWFCLSLFCLDGWGPRYSLHVPLLTSTSSPSSLWSTRCLPPLLSCVLPRASPCSRCASSLAPPPTAVVCPPLASAMWRPPRHPCLVELHVARSFLWSTRGRAYLRSCAPSGRSRSSLYIYQIEHTFFCLIYMFLNYILGPLAWKCDMVLIETASSWAPSVQPKSNDCHRPHQYKIMLSV